MRGPVDTRGAASPGLEPDRRGGIEQVEPGQAPVEIERRRDEAGTARDAHVGQGGKAGRLGFPRAFRRCAATGRPDLEARRPPRAHARERLDGADEQCGRPTGRFGDDVQAVVHPVDKVHVGDAGRPVHHRVAGGPPEAGVRRPVLLADVRLELDDPALAAVDRAFASVAGPLADQTRPQQPAGRRERRPAEELAQIAQLVMTWNDLSESGTSRPKTP